MPPFAHARPVPATAPAAAPQSASAPAPAAPTSSDAVPAPAEAQSTQPTLESLLDDSTNSVTIRLPGSSQAISQPMPPAATASSALQPPAASGDAQTIPSAVVEAPQTASSPAAPSVSSMSGMPPMGQYYTPDGMSQGTPTPPPMFYPPHHAQHRPVMRGYPSGLQQQQQAYYPHPGQSYSPDPYAYQHPGMQHRGSSFGMPNGAAGMYYPGGPGADLRPDSPFSPYAAAAQHQQQQQAGGSYFVPPQSRKINIRDPQNGQSAEGASSASGASRSKSGATPGRGSASAAASMPTAAEFVPGSNGYYPQHHQAYNPYAMQAAYGDMQGTPMGGVPGIPMGLLRPIPMHDQQAGGQEGMYPPIGAGGGGTPDQQAYWSGMYGYEGDYGY